MRSGSVRTSGTSILNVPPLCSLSCHRKAKHSLKALVVTGKAATPRLMPDNVMPHHHTQEIQGHPTRSPGMPVGPPPRVHLPQSRSPSFPIRSSSSLSLRRKLARGEGPVS